MPMKLPSLSICLTINDRPWPVLKAVFDSIATEQFDEIVICCDRTPSGLRSEIDLYIENTNWPAVITELHGEPGWKSPVLAWNKAYSEVSSELTYSISSEVLQSPGNILRAKTLLAGQPAAVYGKCECSCGPDGREVNWNGAAPGNLLVDAAHPRPLGFIMCLPTWVIRATGGYDEGFKEGLWHDDDSYTYSTWQQGVPFIFDDSISGIHQHHERPVLETPEGQAKIELNRAYMLKKWGSLSPWSEAPKRMERVSETQTVIWPA